jgi:hypothetical protein
MSEFSCKEILFDGANEPVRCKCKPAVLKTYQSLMQDGNPQRVAVEAALRVYRFHHPQDSKEDSKLTVERWVFADHHH